jgi:hypothetical protein
MKSGIYGNAVLNISRVSSRDTVVYNTVDVAALNNYSDNQPDDYQSQYFSVNLTSSGNSTIVTGTGSMEIYVDSYNLQSANSTVIFRFISGTGYISGPYTLASGQFSEADTSAIKTNAGESLIINCVGSGLNGHITYHTI